MHRIPSLYPHLIGKETILKELPQDLNPDQAVAYICETVGVERATIEGMTKWGSHIPHETRAAFELAVYVLQKRGLSKGEIGALFHKTASQVSRANQRVAEYLAILETTPQADEGKTGGSIDA